jgi:hypothetical protein
VLASLRILVSALLTSSLFILLATFFVLGTSDGALDPTPLLAVPVVLALGCLFLSETVGYRHPAIAPGTPREEAMRLATTAYTAGTTLRFAICEVVLIITLALAFVVSTGGYLALILAAPLAMALFWFECWPRERPIAKSQASLERDGGVADLLTAYGVRTDAVIQEL